MRERERESEVQSLWMEQKKKGGIRESENHHGDWMGGVCVCVCVWYAFGYLSLCQRVRWSFL